MQGLQFHHVFHTPDSAQARGRHGAGHDLRGVPAIARDVVIEFFGSLTVGEKTYGPADVNTMVDDFKKDELTPQALKPAVGDVMASVLNTLCAAMKKNQPMKKRAPPRMTTRLDQLQPQAAWTNSQT